MSVDLSGNICKNPSSEQFEEIHNFNNDLSQLAENARFVTPCKCRKPSPLHPWVAVCVAVCVAACFQRVLQCFLMRVAVRAADSSVCCSSAPARCSVMQKEMCKRDLLRVSAILQCICVTYIYGKETNTLLFCHICWSFRHENREFGNNLDLVSHICKSPLLHVNISFAIYTGLSDT